MGFSYRKRINLGNGLNLNVSKSGVSVSKKVGNTTINSKGQMNVNLGNGINYKKNLKK